MALDFDVAEGDGEVCVRRALRQLSGEWELAILPIKKQKETLRRRKRVLWTSWAA